MTINGCEFIKSIFSIQKDRDMASKLIRRLSLVPTKIIQQADCGSFYDYNELIKALKKYNCRKGSKSYEIKERILYATRKNIERM